MNGRPMITRDALPDGDYERYRKTFEPLVIRMEGAFSCLTSEGNVASCADGYLAVDSLGFPYPVGAEEFAATYEPVEGDAKA